MPNVYIDICRDRMMHVLRDRHITQHEAARIMGIADTTIHYWLNGRQTPGLDGMIRLCRALGLSLDYLCGLKEGNE
jgi:transcriptional regulator with XRE-family HTH domain